MRESLEMERFRKNHYILGESRAAVDKLLLCSSSKENGEIMISKVGSWDVLKISFKHGSCFGLEVGHRLCRF